MPSIKEIFETHEADTIYIEEWYEGRVLHTHFAFGFKDKIKGEIILNRDGSGASTKIDGNQKAYIDGTNHEFLLFRDSNGADGKLRFFKKIPHVFEIVEKKSQSKIY